MESSALVVLLTTLLVSLGVPNTSHADTPSMRGKIQRLRTEAALMSRAEVKEQAAQRGPKAFVRGVGSLPDHTNANGVVTLNGPVMGRVEVIAISEGDQINER